MISLLCETFNVSFGNICMKNILSLIPDTSEFKPNLSVKDSDEKHIIQMEAIMFL